MEYKDALKIADGVPGALIELGFGKGNSLKEFISYMNKFEISKRNIWIYESFDGYADPAPEDENAFKKGEFKRPPQPAYDIQHTINTEVKLVKGYIEDTLPKNYDKNPVAIVHSHLVSYTSTQHALEYFDDYLQTDGVIVVTDYEVFPGTKLAVDQFVSKRFPHYKIEDTNESFIVLRKQSVKSFDNKVTRGRSVMT